MCDKVKRCTYTKSKANNFLECVIMFYLQEYSLDMPCALSKVCLLYNQPPSIIHTTKTFVCFITMFYLIITEACHCMHIGRNT